MIDGVYVLVGDMRLPLLALGQRVLLLLSKTRVDSREVYEPVFETLGAFALTHDAAIHIQGYRKPLNKVDKRTPLEMVRK